MQMSESASEKSENLEHGSVLVETITAISESDLLVINDGNRTWTVTHVVERDYTETDDDRQSKRAIRLQSGDSPGQKSVFALVLETYPDHHTCELHVLTTPNWYEENEVYPVKSVRHLETDLPWIVTRSNTETFHFPDPAAAGRGEARPICGNGFLNDSDENDYRFARLNSVRPSLDPCKNCARRHRPIEIPKLTCPECDRGIASGLLQGVNVAALDGIKCTCPNHNCRFEGVVSLPIDDQEE